MLCSVYACPVIYVQILYQHPLTIQKHKAISPRSPTLLISMVRLGSQILQSCFRLLSVCLVHVCVFLSSPRWVFYACVI